MPIPYGYRLTPDPEQQRTIKRMIELRGERQSYRAIAEALKADGAVLSHTAVKLILDRNGVD